MEKSMNENMTSSKSPHLLEKVGEFLFTPHHTITEIGERRRARLTLILSFVIATTNLLGLPFVGREGLDATFIVFGVLAAFTISGYLFSRTRYSYWGGVIVVASFSMAGFAFVLTGSDNPTQALFSTLPAAFIIGSALLPVWGNIILIAADIVGIMFLPLIYPLYSYDIAGTDAGLLFTTGALLTAVVIFRNNLERDRLAEVDQMNQALQDLSAGLEQRVADRTRDLELAAEVGRSVSFVRDPLSTLTQAARVIRDRFDLYYTQIYLVDSNRRNLVLRAGTGEVGRTLLARGHRLSLDLASINGTAAVERRSVIVADTENNPIHRPNPLLPETRSEMAIPLVSGDRVVGVLDLQSVNPGALSEENLPAFEALAGQLAVTILNAELFNEVEQARSAVESQARRLTTTGWQDFLNALDRAERLGFSYEAGELSPLEEPIPVQPRQGDLVSTIEISGAPLGSFSLERESSWTEEDRELAASVSRQVSQQIDNLRLLAQAESYRAETQQALRRLTKEGWQGYQQETGLSGLGYVYKDNFVKPLDGNGNGIKSDLAYQLKVREEPIGSIGIAGGKDLSSGDADFLNAITAQLSAHLENLRLSQQTERALAETQVLLDVTNVAGSSFDLSDSLGKVLDLILNAIGFDAGLISMVEPTTNQLELTAYDLPDQMAEFLRKNGLQGSLCDWVYKKAKPLVLEDLKKYSPVDATGSIALGFNSYQGIPLEVKGRILGTLCVFSKRELSPQENDIQLIQAVGRQIGIAIDNVRLFEHTQLSEARLRTIVENAPEAIIIVDVDHGVFTDPNPVAEALYGLPAEELVKVGPADMSPINQPNGRPSSEMAMEYINQALQGGKPVFEWMHTNSAGEEIDCEVRLVRMPDPIRKLVRASVVDIRERKAAEQEVREAQERAQTILESVTLPMVITRLSDNILTFVNQPALDTVQLDYEDVIHLPSPDFYHNLEDRTKFIAELREKGFVSNMEVQLLRKQEEPFWALLSARIFNYLGEPSILTTFSDITDRIRAQEAVAKRAVELATVAEVGTTVSGIMEPEEMLQSVVDMAKERFDLYHAHIYLLDSDGGDLELAAGAGEVGRQMVADGWRIAMDAEQSLVAQAARDRKGVTINDVRQTPGFLPNPLLPKTRAEMAVPLVAGDRLIGVLDVQSEAVGAFSDEDISIQTTLASQVAVALQNVQAYTRTQRQAQQEALINMISQQIQSTTSVESALQVAVRELGRALGAKKTSVKLDVSV